MTKIIGVRFRNTGKVYYFSPGELEIRPGQCVIVETARGMECGRVALPPREVDDSKIVQPLREVIRVATDKDLQRDAANREKEKEAYRIAQDRIRERGLDMKLVQAEYTFDNKKVLFYFTADGRVDFRELVRDLASVFKTRIELRQIGVRDETRLLGGIGICGRPLCCSTYLTEFAPVSIKMAKEQNLSLNPTKISGTCGRLMCCLKNEQDTYEYLNKKLPGLGDIVQTPEGDLGEVNTVNVLRQRVRVLIEKNDDKEIRDYPVEEIQIRMRRKKGKNKSKMMEELLTEEEKDSLSVLEDPEPVSVTEAEDGEERQPKQRRRKNTKDRPSGDGAAKDRPAGDGTAKDRQAGDSAPKDRSSAETIKEKVPAESSEGSPDEASGKESGKESGRSGRDRRRRRQDSGRGGRDQARDADRAGGEQAKEPGRDPEERRRRRRDRRPNSRREQPSGEEKA